MLVIPTVLAALYLGRQHESVIIAGAALLLVELVGVALAAAQHCPRCGGPLVVGGGWRERVAGTCPACGCPID